MDPQQDPQRPTDQQANVPARSQAPARRGPYRVILEQPTGLGRKVLLIALCLVLSISIMFNFGLYGAYNSYVQEDPKITESLHSGDAMAADKIAIISVTGAIMDSEGFAKRQIDRVRNDERVKAVVLRVDSPGGTVTASHYLFHHLKELRKERQIPLVVSMGGIAASGGYYISMAVGEAEDTIFAEETTWTGSIGVIIPSYDISELLAEWKIHDRSYASGDLKQMGSPTRVLTTEQRELETKKFDELITQSFEGFKEVVAFGRPDMVKDKMAMDQVVTGQIFTAKQAQQLGLVDQLGYIEDAVERAAELAKLSEDDYRVVKYNRPSGLFEIALGQGSARSFDLGALLDLTAPRAYYLCTWLPSIAGSANLP